LVLRCIPPAPTISPLFPYTTLFRSIYSASLRVRRDNKHQLLELLDRDAAQETTGEGESISAEAFLYLEISRHSRSEEIAALEEVLREVLEEVNAAVSDYRPMCERVRSVAASIAGDDAIAAEIRAFIEWILNDNFTFLGYEKYCIDYSGDGPRISRDDAASLGLLTQRGSHGAQDLLRDIEAANNDVIKKVLHFSKSSLRARVHRRVYPDYVGIRVVDEQQRIVEEHRFLGLYTSRVYTMSPALIPLIRLKVAAVIERANFSARSHERGELLRVLEVHPRDELFQSSVDELFDTAIAIVQIQERRLIRLFVRKDATQKFINCLVFMPRDIYTTQLRIKVQRLLCEAFGAMEAEFSTYFSESILTRTHFVLRTDPAAAVDRDPVQLQAEIVEVCMSWQDHLRNHLIEEFGEEQGLAIATEYADAFPVAYRDDCAARAAVADIRKFATLQSDSDIAMGFYQMLGDEE